MTFEPSVDLSDFDSDAIKAIRKARKAQFANQGLERRAGAAVIDRSIDAALVMRLWNAFSNVDGEIDLRFAIFQEIDPALERLEILYELAAPAIEATLQLSSARRVLPAPRR